MINWVIINTEQDTENEDILNVSVLITAELDSFKQNKYLDTEVIYSADLTNDDILYLVKEKLGEIEVDKIEEKLINFVESKKAEKDAKSN